LVTTHGSINVDVMRWKRLADVYDYAAQHAIPLEQAVETLVNRGLSHVTPPWQQVPVEPYRRPGQR
jgi:hypothetical protein